MKKVILLSLIIFCSACVNSKERNKEFNDREEKPYEIVCKHPFGHIVKYEVEKKEFNYPSNANGGIWFFKTKSGLKVRSTFCHTEGF